MGQDSSNDFVTVQSSSIWEIGLIDFNWQNTRSGRAVETQISSLMGQAFLRYESLKVATYNCCSNLTSVMAKTRKGEREILCFSHNSDFFKFRNAFQVLKHTTKNNKKVRVSDLNAA